MHDLGDGELIAAALGALEPALRAAIVLNAGAGLPACEVAGVLGITPAAAARRISRAKRRFRTEYALLEGKS